ncbi:MAG: Fe-S cluster assembly protein SufD [Fimbriimonadaceae bacterium]|nr:Fe-S cluster assembly protein SufD [Fimbriimonadaceae bacterium]
MSAATGFTVDQVRALAARHDEPAWLLEQRLAAFEAWQAAPYPSSQDEDWRRSDFRHLDLERGLPLVTPNGGAHPRPDAADAAGFLSFCDGQLAAQRLAPELEAAGVVLCPLHTALRTHGDLIRDSLMTRCVPVDEDPFTRLHAALWTAGTFLYVPDGVTVPAPLLSAVQLSHGGVAALHHTLVIAGSGAQVEVVEESSGGSADRTLSVPVVEVLAGSGSQVGFSAIQTWHHGVTEVAHRRVWTGRDAQVRLTVGSLGCQMVKSFVGAVLAGEGGSAKLAGIYFPEGGQHLDYTTMQDHRVPHCTSELLFKGALYDRAQAIFRGVVRVRPEAQQTDAYQTNNNLLLGQEARADSMPVLEIEADDVKCSHGATLAHLNDEDLFYLRSRGLESGTAQRMVIAGFFEPVLTTIPLTSLREQLQQAVRERIAQH